MPPNRPTSRRQRRRLRARATGLTHFEDAFRWVADNDKDRINVLVEGDSWFAYPKDWLIHGESSNVVTQIFYELAPNKLLNGLCLASNGDTAKEMMTGDQLKKTRKLVRKHGKRLDLCLFSAGGNDVAGPDDLRPLLHTYQPGMNAADCINEVTFGKKLDDIEKYYKQLIQIRNTHAKNMRIVTHTYDFLQPNDRGAEFLWGVEVSGPWIKPTLVEKEIPETKHGAVVKILLQRFRAGLEELAANNEKFHVVNTQGTLRFGNQEDWLNEIHPTPTGFRKIAAKIYKEMRKHFSTLPVLPHRGGGPGSSV